MIYRLSLLLSLGTLAICAQSAPSANASATPFSGKTLAAPHIYVEAPSQHVKWTGGAVPQGDYDPAYYERLRVGTVAFGPGLSVHVDVIRNNVHFPSFYELIEATSGTLLGKYPVLSPDDVEWYFSGSGAAYLNQTNLSLCGPRVTRKIVQKNKKLVEVAQALTYVGVETDVESPTQLFESPNSRNVVATVLPGNKVVVIGLQPGKTELFESAYLVKTPFGLTGWHLPSNGRLSVYNCN